MRTKKTIPLSTGKKVSVLEISSAGLDVFNDLITQAAATQYQDAAMKTLARLYYPILAACSDNPPSLEDVYKIAPPDLDTWFLAACQLNPDWLGDMTYTEEPVKLNGFKVTVKSRRPSVEMRLARLQETIPAEKPLDNPNDEEYRLAGYIGAAACSEGEVPTAYQAKHDLSLKEFNLWHSTVRRLVPEWYETPEDVAKRTQGEQVEEKKSDNAPAA